MLSTQILDVESSTQLRKYNFRANSADGGNNPKKKKKEN